MSRYWILTVAGKDQPGIVAGVTKALFQLGCNLEDSEMTRLGGEFAMMVVFAAPAKATQAAIDRAFAILVRKMKLTVTFKPLSKQEVTPPKHAGPRCMISVYGADHPGIVFRVSEVLAKEKVNIVDVHTHRTPTGTGKSKSLYLMLLDVEVPTKLSLETLDRRLQQLGKQLGVDVTVRSAEAEVL